MEYSALVWVTRFTTFESFDIDFYNSRDAVLRLYCTFHVALLKFPIGIEHKEGYKLFGNFKVTYLKGIVDEFRGKIVFVSFHFVKISSG